MTRWYDLDPEERGYWMDLAEDGGTSWYDLDPETRGSWMERAEGEW